MKNHVQVVIIGGGIIGCSIAYYLSKKGMKPLVIDSRGIGEGTSSGGDGFVLMQTKKPGLQLELANRSADMYEKLENELGYATQYHRPGGLIVIETPEERKVMEQVVQQQIAMGMDIELISGKKARELEPLLSKNVNSATYCPKDGDVSPICTTRAFAKRAAELGAEFWLHTPVLDIKTNEGSIESVVTSRGEVITPIIINAAGVWSPYIGRMTCLNIPIKPRRGHLLISEAIAPVLKMEILCARYIAIKHNPKLAEQTTDSTLALGVSLTLEQSENGNLIIGSNREFAGYDLNASSKVVQAIAQYSTRFMPMLKDINIIRSFVGMRPYCEDGVPIVGSVNTLDGMFIASGHEGDGIALAPITGDLISDMVLGRKTEFDVSSFSFNRFLN